MSKMEGFVFLDPESKASDKSNVEKEKKASFGNTTRKKLADISNLPQQARVSTLDEKSHLMPIAMIEYIDQLKKENLALVKILADRNKIIEVTGIELQKMRVNMQKLQQQNLQLAQSNSRMLADLNSGKDRLKALQHELGCKSGLLKARKFEKEETLKSKKCEKFDDELELSNCEAAELTKESFKVDGDDGKCVNTRRRTKSKSLDPRQVQSKDEIENKRPYVRRRSSRFGPKEIKPSSDQLETEDTKIFACFPSIEGHLPREDGSASTSVPVQDEGKEQVPRHEAGNKRRFVRRQSARFKSEEPKPSDDLFQIVDASVAASLINDGALLKVAASVIQDEDREGKHTTGHEAGNKRPCVRRQSARFNSEEPKPSDASAIHDDGTSLVDVSSSTSLSLKNEDNKVNPAPGFETLESKRSSLSRPLREAAKKVHSYKEIPLNIKMRRSQ